MKIENVLIVDPIDGEYPGHVHFEDGIITHVEYSPSKPEAILMPGFVDIHTHGVKGVDFFSERDGDKWIEASEFFYKNGVTTFLPTSMSGSLENIKDFLSFVEYISDKIPSVYGAHLEGPYISTEEKGAQDERYIRKPKMEEVKELVKHKSLKTITIAPEICEEAVLDLLMDNEIVLSLGHSNSDYKTSERAFYNGFKRITHFPNGIKGLHHREVGVFGAGLLLPFYLEMIVDMVHLSAEMINLTLKLKTYDKIILVTDSIPAAGLDDGIYQFNERTVKVRSGKVTLDDGTLAGSVLTFNEAVKNFKKITGCSLKDLTKVTSYNAVKNLEIKNSGRITEGYFADVVVLDFDLNVIEVYKSGKRVWGR